MTLQLTQTGKDLILQSLEVGSGITFSTIVMGNGANAGTSAKALSNQLATIDITDITREDDSDYITLNGTLNNANLSAGFTCTELGVKSIDPTDEDGTDEVLFAYGYVASGAMVIPSPDDSAFETYLSVIVYVGETEDVTAIITTSAAYASKTEFESLQADFETHIGDTSNPHSVTKSQVGLGNVPNVTTNNQTPTYSDTTTLATLSSGEKLSTAFAKIKLAITKLINHLSDTDNPHGITAEDIGAADESHTHSASDITSGTLSVTRGGTGLSSPTSGGLMKGNGSSAMTALRGTGALYSTSLGNPTFGTLPASMGGTGNTNGTAASLTTARTIQTNLESTDAASFDGTANVTPGVTGILPVENGGTGVSSLESLVSSLGTLGIETGTVSDATVSATTNYSTGYTSATGSSYMELSHTPLIVFVPGAQYYSTTVIIPGYYTSTIYSNYQGSPYTRTYSLKSSFDSSVMKLTLSLSIIESDDTQTTYPGESACKKVLHEGMPFISFYKL